MWKDVTGWDDLYEVNEFGDVRNKVTKRMLKGDKNSSGYPRVILKRKDHHPKYERFFRHRLVATAFVDNPNNLPEVDHIDCNKDNSYYKNLRWVTPQENIKHCYYSGGLPYNPFMVEKIDGIYTYDNKSDLAYELRVSTQTIDKWLNGKSTTYENHGINLIKYIERGN